MPTESKTIARNTLMLYFRQILILLTGLYTVRVVMEVLGVEDYGIYNVTAGIVTMFGFLSSSMATASQRFFSFEIASGSPENLRKTFSIIFIIYVILVIIVIAIAQTVGLWFLNTKLVIPASRLTAARWIYQFTIFSFAITMLTTPYMAAIIAHENMNVYAYVSIIEALLKLSIVLLLKVLPYDKLIIYGLLLFVVSSINTALYRIFCIRHYDECRFSFVWDKAKFKEIISYSGWNLFGSSVGIVKNQVVNILLNLFFGPLVNAARGVAIQVNNAVTSFAYNFTVAIRPQIIKRYAAGEKKSALTLVFSGCKYAFFLIFLFTMPLVLEMNYILTLWLKTPPEAAVIFTRLALIDTLVNSISYQIMTLAQATGKIKLYQGVVGGLLLLNLPVCYIVLKLGAPAYSVMLIAIIISIIAAIVRILIVKCLTDFPIKKFIAATLLPVIVVTFCAVLVPGILHYIMEESILRFCTVVLVAVGMTIFCVALLGLSKDERKYLLNIIKCKISKKK